MTLAVLGHVVIFFATERCYATNSHVVRETEISLSFFHKEVGVFQIPIEPNDCISLQYCDRGFAVNNKPKTKIKRFLASWPDRLTLHVDFDVPAFSLLKPHISDSRPWIRGYCRNGIESFEESRCPSLIDEFDGNFERKRITLDSRLYAVTKADFICGGDHPRTFNASNSVGASLCGGSGYSSRFVSSNEEADLYHGYTGQNCREQDECSGKSRNGIVRGPLPKGFPIFLAVIAFLGFFGTLAVAWVMGLLGGPHGESRQPEDTEQKR